MMHPVLRRFKPVFSIALISTLVFMIACGSTETIVKEVEVPGETVVVEKEVVKTVEVPGETITKEVVKTVEVPGETVVVEKEVKAEVKVVEIEKLVYVDPADPAATPQYGGHKHRSTADWVNLDPRRFGPGAVETGYWAEKLIINDWAVDRADFDFPASRGVIRPDLAKGLLLEKWSLDADFMGIDMTIRDNVFFHDKAPTNGRALTVEDLQYNMDGWWHDEFIDRQYSSLIESTEKTGDMDLHVTLNSEVATPYTLIGILDNDSHFILPEEIRDPETESIEDWKKVSGTGAWMLTDLVPDSHLTFEKNPNYWGFDEKNPGNRLPYPDAITRHIIPDKTTELAAFRAGKIDVLYNLALKEVGSLLLSNPEAKTKTVPHSSPLAFRMRWDLEPFNDLRLRKAVSMAFDRQTIADTYYEGQALYYSGLLKPFHEGIFIPYDELPDDIKEIMEYNPAKARELVKEAGYGDGLTVDLNIGPRTDFGEMAVILQQYLQDIGITAEIIRDEWPEFNAKRYGKKHRHAIIHWNSFYANPMQLFQWFVCDPDEAPYPECLHKFGLSGVNDPVFTDNYKKARATFDDAERAQMMQDMELYQLRDVFFATLPNPNVVNIWQPWIGGFQGEGEPGQYQSGALDARTWIVPELR